MAQKGDCYTFELKSTHISWGTIRYTNSRGIIYGEGYIKIPSACARNFKLYNSNGPTGLGLNEFRCTSSDGIFSGLVKTSGCSKAGEIYAKNMHGSGNLKAIGDWYYKCGAQPGDIVKVEWTSPYDIVISLYKNSNYKRYNKFI